MKAEGPVPLCITSNATPMDLILCMKSATIFDLI